MWQWPACTHFYVRAGNWWCVLCDIDQLVAQWGHWERGLFLLENSALKFDSSGMEGRNKHDIFKSQYQLGEFHHLYNELRNYSTKFFEYCKMSPSTFDYIVQAIRQYISHISTNFQRTISVEERLFVTLRQVQHATHLTYFIQFHDGASLVHWKTFIMTQICW